MNSTTPITYTKVFQGPHVVGQAPDVPQLGPEPHVGGGHHLVWLVTVTDLCA